MIHIGNKDHKKLNVNQTIEPDRTHRDIFSLSRHKRCAQKIFMFFFITIFINMVHGTQTYKNYIPIKVNNKSEIRIHITMGPILSRV